MYLEGMGGMGKTQVIKALASMFNQRQEGHRFIVLAPTGTAAALLNGLHIIQCLEFDHLMKKMNNL